MRCPESPSPATNPGFPPHSPRPLARPARPPCPKSAGRADCRCPAPPSPGPTPVGPPPPLPYRQYQKNGPLGAYCLDLLARSQNSLQVGEIIECRYAGPIIAEAGPEGKVDFYDGVM